MWRKGERIKLTEIDNITILTLVSQAIVCTPNSLHEDYATLDKIRYSTYLVIP